MTGAGHLEQVPVGRQRRLGLGPGPRGGETALARVRVGEGVSLGHERAVGDAVEREPGSAQGAPDASMSATVSAVV
jgi:hypothetical protein